MFGRASLLMAVAIYIFAADFNDNCPLSGQSLYGFQVRIWDKVRTTSVAHGSIIAYLAVVTGCSEFHENNFPYKDPLRYEVIGQNLSDMQRFAEINMWCTQTREVKQIIPHPKCLEEKNPSWEHKNLRTSFDFSIFLLKEPFNTEGSYSYPTFTLPNSARALLMDIVSLNVEINPECEVPIFLERNERLPRARSDCLVKSIPFHYVCVDLFCNNTVPEETYRCYEFFSRRANATQLCQRPLWSTKIDVPDLELNWFVGTPYACNGTSYGHAGTIKKSQTFTDDDHKQITTDFWYVPTYLRVWPWLRGAIYRFGADSFVKPFYVEAQSITPQSVATPSRDPILDQILPQRVPHKQVLDLPKNFEKLWYRSSGPSFRLSGFVFSFILIGTQI